MTKKPAQSKGREASAATKGETEKSAPAPEPAPAAPPAPARSAAAVLAEAPRPQPRILVVDDEPHVVQIFQDLLAQRGYEVVSSTNGDDAILKVTTESFDLVLTDINLPGVDGLEVVRAAKAADKDTCVILITGYASTTTAIDALRQGAYDYITKPFDLWETAKAIDRGLESRFLVLENRRLVVSLEKANRELQHHEQILSRMVKDATQRITALYESGKEISTSLSRQATLDVIVNQVAKLAGAELSLVFLYDTDAGQYVAEAGAAAGGGTGAGPGAIQERVKEYRFGIGEGLHGQAVRNMTPVRSAAIAETIGIEAFLSELEVSSALIVPLLTNEGVLGTITALRRSGRGFTPDDQEQLSMFASQASIALTNAILYERTKELDRMKSEFVAVVSHEVRTPLTSIKGSLELLGDERFHVLPPPQKELLSICQANTERLISLINDILDFSKLESSKLSLNFENFDVGRVVPEAVDHIRNLAAMRGITIDVHIEGTAGALEADPMRVAQVITNLLGNAIKFSPEKGKIEVWSRGTEEEVTVDIKDFGKGISQRDLSRLFQRFAQLDSSTTRRAGGTGLGLVISKGIVEQHGGRIWVDSTMGVGSTFSFSLPRRRAAGLSAEEFAENSGGEGSPG
ncbi:MAG TPA: ATP-binding protein [Candidatus Dormibacteraeota bacterium]|nr:ATP-binding protein [Candidatus Dormibacteraeota bacterium]